MTLLITSITADTLEALKERAERAWSWGAEAVEVRIDTFKDDPAALNAYLKAHADRTWIVTCRSADEGGEFTGSVEDRVSLLRAVVDGTRAYIDFEFADWVASVEVRNRIQEIAADSSGEGGQLILSAHEFAEMEDTGRAGSTRRLPKWRVKPALLLDQLPDGAIAKVAYESNHIVDAFDALDLMHERGDSIVAIAMGESGLWTRVLAKKFGAFATYSALDSDAATAPGQLTLGEMLTRYRWSAMRPSTRVFGVIGDPIGHSMSPILFNHWFEQAGIDAVYLPFRVGSEGDGLARFLEGCRQRPWLDVGGFSVTIPHKQAALEWVGDGADWMPRRIGALNTLSWCDGKVRGYNTDCYAVVSSVVEALGGDRNDLVGLRVDVLGTGGAAMAVLYGLPMSGCKATVYGRSEETTRKLAARYEVRPACWEDRTQGDGDVLINCTSVGMSPHSGASPMPAKALERFRLVFDVIYNPLETRLLKDAASLGVSTLNGLDMFIRQAATQFELWTGEVPDTESGYDLVAGVLASGAVVVDFDVE